MDHFRFARSRTVMFGLTLALMAGIVPVEADARELIKNGEFNKRLSKWRIESNDRFNAWFFPDKVGSTSPLNLQRTTKNPRGGKTYAIADQRVDSYILMRQKFRIPRGARKVILNFRMFADSFAPVVKEPNAFNLNKESQQARVDLLTGTAKAKDVTGGVVKQLYTKGADAVEAPKPPRYRHHRINLTRFVTPGQSYQLRFSVISTEETFLLGVDNVSVKTR